MEVYFWPIIGMRFLVVKCIGFDPPVTDLVDTVVIVLAARVRVVVRTCAGNWVVRVTSLTDVTVCTAAAAVVVTSAFC